MSIFDVRHQPAAQSALQRGLASTRTPHAYIFHGPDGVGKEMLAQRFAQLLLCERRNANRFAASHPSPADTDLLFAGGFDAPPIVCAAPPDVPPEYAALPITWRDSCGTCRSCVLLATGTHPDCHLIHRRLSKHHDNPEVRRRKAMELGIPVIRQFVIDAVGKKAALGSGKVFILRDCDRFNKEAQNALLKTLEEPPPDTYLILLWPGLKGMLATTRSRCQMVPFRTLPAEFIAEQLARQRPDLPRDQVAYFSRHEPGSLGAALRLVDDGYFEANTHVLTFLTELKRTDSVRLAEHIQKLGEQQAKAVHRRLAEQSIPDSPAGTDDDTTGTDESEDEDPEDLTDKAAARQAMQSVLGMMATVYRDALNLRLGRPEAACNPLSSRLVEMAQRISPDSAHQAIRAISDAEYRLSTNANTRLTLDTMAIQLARLSGEG